MEIEQIIEFESECGVKRRSSKDKSERNCPTLLGIKAIFGDHLMVIFSIPLIKPKIEPTYYQLRCQLLCVNWKLFKNLTHLPLFFIKCSVFSDRE